MDTVLRRVLSLRTWLCALMLLVGCEADPAATLDAPRFLAVRASPPRLVEGTPVQLDALTFEMSSALRWQWCGSNWVPPAIPSEGDALVCSAGEPVPLGVGPTVTLDPPTGLSALWVLVEAPAGEEALPTVRLLEATGAERNPSVVEITQLGPQPAPLLRVEEAITLLVTLGDGDVPEDHVATWYVTAGELLPERTVGAETVTLTAPSTAGPLDVVVVVRNADGGIGWLTRTFAVQP